MDPQLDELVKMYRTSKQGHFEASVKRHQAERDVAALKGLETMHGDVVRALAPLISKLPGGNEAMGEVNKEVVSSGTKPASAHAAQPSQPRREMPDPLSGLAPSNPDKSQEKPPAPIKARS